MAKSEHGTVCDGFDLLATATTGSAPVGSQLVLSRAPLVHLAAVCVFMIRNHCCCNTYGPAHQHVAPYDGGISFYFV